MPWLRLTSQFGPLSIVNMDQVVRMQAVEEGSRLTTTAVDPDGPHYVTVTETPDEILAMLNRAELKLIEGGRG